MQLLREQSELSTSARNLKRILRWFRMLSGQSDTYLDTMMIRSLRKVFYGTSETTASGRLAMVPT